MPQQHPGRLQILVVDAHCKRRLFSTKTPTDPDELARRFCTPDNCLVVVLRDNLNHRDCDCLWNPFSDFSFTT
ncbi:hypothetical protein CEC90_18980 [Salmonella enterica subsp. enterica serovar Typhimurium]|nr:hypothetical protein [Salmonella enterica subsp. enterica serovar Typhimurium]